jgi:hypothetical protein
MTVGTYLYCWHDNGTRSPGLIFFRVKRVNRKSITVVSEFGETQRVPFTAIQNLHFATGMEHPEITWGKS